MNSKIRREKLSDIKAKDFIKTFHEVGVGGKRLPEKELREVVRGTRFDKKFSHDHRLSPGEAEEISKLIIQKHGHSNFDVQKLEKKFQAEQQTIKPTNKSSDTGFFRRVFGRPKATSSTGAYNSSEQRRVGSVPPIQSPPTTQKPNLQTFKSTPSMKK